MERFELRMVIMLLKSQKLKIVIFTVERQDNIKEIHTHNSMMELHNY